MTEQLWFVIQSMHKVWDRLNMDRFLGKQQAKEEAMKVQAKLLSDHYQYEVVEESSHYYIVYGFGGKVAVSKADYEPVQEWVDVTKYCNLLEDAYGRYSLFHHTRGIRADDPLYLVTRQSGSYKVEVKR